MSIPIELVDVLSTDPNVMSGVLCFTGTRIPVQVFLDNCRAGIPVGEFLDAYPDLTRDQVQAVINWEDGQARKILGLELAR